MIEHERTAPAEITGLLRAWRAGSPDALDRLLPLVYDELLSIARRHLRRERSGHTLTAPALVNEAYLALLQQSAVAWQDRVHFFAIASRTMRRVLVWHARRRNAAKRDGGAAITLDESLVSVGGERTDADDLLALDEALVGLVAVDTRLCRVVECRYFGGLTVAETAEALAISPATVKRDWQAARAWLRIAIEGRDR